MFSGLVWTGERSIELGLADATGSYRTIFFFAPLWVAIGFLILLRTRATPLEAEVAA